MILFSRFRGNKVTRVISNRIEAIRRIAFCPTCVSRQMSNALKGLGIEAKVSIRPDPLDSVVMGDSRYPDVILVNTEGPNGCYARTG